MTYFPTLGRNLSRFRALVVLLNLLLVIPMLIAACGDSSSATRLEPSGPIEATTDGQVIENLQITSTNGPAIVVKGHADVVIRNVEIHHAGGPGIEFSAAPNILIENAVIVHTGAPASGPNSSTGLNNIKGTGSPGAVIRRVRLTRGSSGIYLINSENAHLSFIEGHDFRGPFPRGQLVQVNKSDNGILEDFSSENPQATSWPEDNVSIFQSINWIVRRGLVDGNNSPKGVGIQVETSDGRVSNTLVEDVDAVRQGNGCFSANPGIDVTFRRTKCRENICTDQGRGLPASNALVWAGVKGFQTGTPSINIRLEDSKYFDICNPTNLVWDKANFTLIEITENDFTLRAPIRNNFLWESSESSMTPTTPQKPTLTVIKSPTSESAPLK